MDNYYRYFLFNKFGWFCFTWFRSSKYRAYYIVVAISKIYANKCCCYSSNLYGLYRCYIRACYLGIYRSRNRNYIRILFIYYFIYHTVAHETNNIKTIISKKKNMSENIFFLYKIVICFILI